MKLRLIHSQVKGNYFSSIIGSWPAVQKSARAECRGITTIRELYFPTAKNQVIKGTRI